MKPSAFTCRVSSPGPLFFPFSLTVKSRVLQSEPVLSSELHLCAQSSARRLASGGGLESFTECSSCDLNLEKSVGEGKRGESSLGSRSHVSLALRTGSWRGCCWEWTRTLWAPWGFIPALHPCSPPSVLSQAPRVIFLRGPDCHQSWGTVVHASGFLHPHFRAFCSVSHKVTHRGSGEGIYLGGTSHLSESSLLPSLP